MAAKDSLHSLVRSLSKGEKSFFVKALSNSRGAEESNYLKLFYALDQLDIYDEDKLLKKLKGADFVKHLPVIKNYLLNAILKQLKQYHYDSSPKNALLETLRDSDMMVKKSLYKESYRLLLKAEKIALKYEYFTFCLEIYDRLLRLNYDLPSDKEANNYSLAIYKKQEEVLDKLSEIAKQKYLRSLRNDIDCNVADSGEQKKRYLHLLENDLLKPGFRYSSYKSGVYHYHTRSRIHMQLGTNEGREKGYEISRDFIKHLESDPDLLQVNLINYANALNNHIVLQGQLKLHSEALKTLDKLTSIKTESEYLKYRVKERVIANRLTWFLFAGKYTEGVNYIEEVEGDLIENPNQYHNNFYMAVIDSFQIIYFLNGDFTKALKWTNFILGYKNFTRPDILRFTKILNLMIHYELKNEDHLEYLLRPTRAFLVKHHAYDSYSKEMLDFFAELITLKGEKETKRAFAGLAEDLRKFEEEDGSKIIFQLLNLRDWALKKSR